MEIKKSDFIFFKNEVLEDIKKLENRINNKIIVNSDILVEKINLNKNNISDNNKKIFEMMKLISNEEEKIKINSSLNSFKAKIDEFVLLNDTKLTYLEKQFNEISFKYDKIFIISNLFIMTLIKKIKFILNYIIINNILISL